MVKPVVQDRSHWLGWSGFNLTTFCVYCSYIIFSNVLCAFVHEGFIAGRQAFSSSVSAECMI